MEDNCNNKCRACLSENDAMLSLFEVYEHDLTLAMILKSCISNVEVSENDGLPSYLCDNCILVLTQFYNFTVVYEESDRYLKSLFKKNIKHVPINIPVEVDVSELKEEQKDEVLELQEVCELTDSNSGDVLFDENELKQQIEELKEEVLDEKDPQLTEHSDVVTTIMPVYEEVTKYECTICGEAHLYASAFQQHMRVKHRMSDIDCKPYASKIQIKVFENLPKKPIQTQVKTGEGEDPSSYVCKYCNKKCAYAGQLQQHLKLHEGNKNTYARYAGRVL